MIDKNFELKTDSERVIEMLDSMGIDTTFLTTPATCSLKCDGRCGTDNTAFEAGESCVPCPVVLKRRGNMHPSVKSKPQPVDFKLPNLEVRDFKIRSFSQDKL